MKKTYIYCKIEIEAIRRLQAVVRNIEQDDRITVGKPGASGQFHWSVSDTIYKVLNRVKW
jgi:flavorubredoxin